MYQHKRVFGENPFHGIAAFLGICVIIGYFAMFAHNVSNVRRDVTQIGHQVGVVMLAANMTTSTQVVWPVANHARKSDKSLASALSDDEVAGDVADAEESTFGKRFAALEQK